LINGKQKSTINFVKKIIGLVGPIASGKGTVAAIFQKHGYSYYSLSDRIREEITKNTLPINRKSLQLFGNSLRREFGSSVLAKKTASLISADNPDTIVIDSIRNPGEVNFLKEKYDIYILGITANQKKRFDFMIKRGRRNEKIEFDKFKALDDQELENYDEHTQQINKTLKFADLIIENNSTLDALKKKVEKAFFS